MMKSLLLTIPVLLALPSCSFARFAENEPIDAVVVAELVPGRTTLKEAVEKLGGPSDVVPLGKNGTALRYDHSMRKAAVLILIVLNVGNIDTRSDRVWLFFDENNVLTAVGKTLQSHHAQYAMTWEDIHEAEDGAARDADRPGLDGGRK
jgi:hypothetical protein